MKKILALMLCLCMVLALCAGCGASETAAQDEPAAEETAAEAPAEEAEAAQTEDTEEPEETIGIGLGGSGFNTYPAEMVVGTVNGTDVTWMEYYYWLNSYAPAVIQTAAQYGILLNKWDDTEFTSSFQQLADSSGVTLKDLFGIDLTNENTNADVAILLAQQGVIQYHAIISKAEELGIELSEEEYQTIQSIAEQNADTTFGDGDGIATEEELDAFAAYLLAEQSIDREFFDYLTEVSLLENHEFAALYGEKGENASDEDVMSFAEENGLMGAKHILLLTVDPDTREPLSEEEIAEKKQRAEDLLAQLQELGDDQEAMIALFDELTAEYTEDTGYAYYPDGYVFTEGQMVSQFEDAVKELEVYELSDVVESDYGYHIILRIPVTADAIIGTDANGNNSTLRQAAASRLFLADENEWFENADVVWYEDFETPDMQAIFG